MILSITTLSLAISKDVFLGVEYKAGLIPMPDGDDMFYWIFPKPNSTDGPPLVLWLTGGPGCSSELAVFYENGPFKFKNSVVKGDIWNNFKEFLSDNKNELELNPYSWHFAADLIYLDQPIGTGYSRCSKFSHYEHSEE